MNVPSYRFYKYNNSTVVFDHLLKPQPEVYY